jgi:hypothetical protein
MFIISGGRGIGKTKALLERVKAENAIVVCEDVMEMRERAYGYGIVGLNIISYEDYCRTPGEILNKPVYVHNVNNLLKRINSNTKGYSVCNE